MYKTLFIIFLVALIPNMLLAKTHKEAATAHKKHHCCIPTKSVQIPLSEKPIEYAHYNNITQQEGEFPDNFVNKIIIKGKVTDKNCVPIPNVRITISQQDEYGIYRFIRTFVPVFEKSYKLNYQQHSTFSGTGTTSSNNQGEFTFITSIPNSRTRHLDRIINITTEHINYPDISGKIFLGHHIDKHKVHKNFIFATEKPKTQKVNKQNLPVYTIDLVLDGVSEYKRY